MKIKELLKEIAPKAKSEFITSITGIESNSCSLNSSLIRTNLKKIQECEEFEDSEVIVVSRPILEGIEKEEVWQVLTLKLSDDMKFKNRCYLYSLELQDNEYVIARGLFESWEINGEIKNNETYDVNLDMEPKYGMVFYLEKEMTEGNVMNMKVCNKIIPLELQESFYEKFGKNNLNITEDLINEFLQIHKVHQNKIDKI